MQVGPGGSAWNSKHLADLDVSESFDVVKHDHRPCSIRKLCERVGKTALELRILRGIPKRRLKGITQLLGRPDFSAADDIQRSVRDDAVEPRSKSLRWIEPFKRSPGPDEAFLYCIFRILVNSHDRPCNEVRPPLVHTHQTREGSVVACAGRFGQRAFLIWDTHRAD